MSRIGWALSVVIALEVATIVTFGPAAVERRRAIDRPAPVSCVVEDRRSELTTWMAEHAELFR